MAKHKPPRVRLVEDWHQALSFYSVQLAGVIALCGILQSTVLPMWQAQLSDFHYALLNTALAVVLGLARLLQQGPPQEPEE